LMTFKGRGAPRHVSRPPTRSELAHDTRVPHPGGSSSPRGGPGAWRHRTQAQGAALANHRVRGDVATGPLLTTRAGCVRQSRLWQLFSRASIGWPFGALAGWMALNLGRPPGGGGRRRRQGEARSLIRAGVLLYAGNRRRDGVIKLDRLSNSMDAGFATTRRDKRDLSNPTGSALRMRAREAGIHHGG